MHKNRARRKKEDGTAEAILKPCHVVMENLDLKLSTNSTSHLLSDLSHTVVEMLNESCFEQETNSCSNTVKLNKSDVNLKKRVRTFDIQSNRSKNKQVPLDSFHSFRNKRSQSSASDTDVDNIYSIKKKKQRKFNKYVNSETRFGKNSTMKKISNKSIGKGLIDKNSKYLSSKEICSPESGYRLNHLNISASNEYFAEDSRYVPQNIDLKECSVVITKTDLSRISGMKDAVTLKSSIKQTDINVGKRNCKRSSCSSVNSSNSVLAVSDSFRSSDNKSANHQSSHTFAMQTLINDTNTEDSGNLKRRYSVDSSSSTEIGSEMNRTNYSHIDEDIYSKATTLKLDNFKTEFRELDAESNISTSSLAELRRSCNVDNFSDTDIDEKTEKEVNYPLTYFAHKFKHDISGSGSESDVIDNSEKKRRNVSEVPLSVYNSDAKCEMREDPLHSDTFLNDCDQRKRGRKKKSLDFETASNYSDHITKAGRRKHSDSETSSDVHALNYSSFLSAIASNYSYTIPYGHRTLKKKCSHSEASLNCVDSGNDSNCTDYKFKSKGSSNMKSSKCKTASNCSNLTLNAKRSRRKHSDSETSLNYSDYNSKNKKHLKKKPKIGSNYSDLALKAKINRRKHSDSETSVNYSDYNSEYKKRLKKKPKTGSNYSDIALKAKRNRRKLSDSETDSNYSDSVNAKKSSRKKHLASLKYSDSKYKKKSRKKLSSLNYSISIPHANRRLRRKRLDSETSLNSDSNIASGYCNSTAKCKVNRRKKPLHSEMSNYSNSIYKYERNEKKKTLEYKTASDYSERNVQQKLLDSETSSNCSDSISKRKRIGRHKVLHSGISSNCYDSTSKLKIRSKSLDSENSLNLSAMQISPHLSDCETDSNSSVSTVLVPDKVKSTDKNLFVNDHSRSNEGRRKCAEKLNNLNKTGNRKNAQKLVIDDFCDHEDKAVLFAKHHIEEKVNKNAFSECSKACNVLLTRLNLNCNNHFESSKMTNDEEYDQDKIDIGKKNNVEMAGRDTSAVSINSSTVQDAAINDPNLKDSFVSILKTTETRKIHRKHTRFMSDNDNSPDIVGDNLKSHVANEKWQNFSKVPAEHNKNNVVSFLESRYIQSENDKNGEKGLKSDHSNYVFKSVTGKNYVIDFFDGEGIEKLYVTVVLKSDSNSKETIKCSSDINKLEENCEFGCKKYKYNCIHMNKSSKIITDSSSPKKNSKKFCKNTNLLKDEGGKCESVFHDTNSPKKNSKNTDLQKSDSGRCESILEPSSSPKKQPAGDDHSKVFNSLSDKYTNIDNLMHYSSHKQNITSVISDKSCQKSTNTLKQKPTNQTAYKRTNTKCVGLSSDSCIQCFTEFSSLRDSYKHTCFGKQKRGYLCMYCEKIFPSCKSIQTHERIHKNAKA